MRVLLIPLTSVQSSLWTAQIRKIVEKNLQRPDPNMVFAFLAAGRGM